MPFPDKKIRYSLLVAGSIALTFLTINKLGAFIQNFETRVYQELSGKRSQYLQSDSTGVPVVVYEGNLGRQYNSVAVSEEAIKLSVQKDSSDCRKFFGCINWLIKNNRDLNDSSIIFLDYYNWPAYKMTSPWRSAMNQGRAMQAFLRAFEKTGDSTYLNYARKSMNVLFTEVKDGGVTYKDSTGYWYEEYADDNVPQSRVLNGMIVVLQALNDFYRITNNQDALFLFRKGVSSVKSNLHYYDNDGHSNYDILGKPAKPWYHEFHIELLDFLYNETHDHIFNDYKHKWMRYKEPSYLRGLIQKPTRIGVFAILSLFIAILTLVFGINFLAMKEKKL
jgi:hypothetical protein